MEHVSFNHENNIIETGPRRSCKRPIPGGDSGNKPVGGCKVAASIYANVASSPRAELCI